MKACSLLMTSDVYNRWITSNFPFKWHRTPSTTSGWKSSIFNRNSSGEDRLKFIASGEDDDNKKPRATHGEHCLVQRRQRRQHSDHKHEQRQRQNTSITLQMEPMKRENTDCRRFKKGWEDQATLTVYSKIIFDSTIGSNSYTICTMHVKNSFPTYWGQPISLYTINRGRISSVGRTLDCRAGGRGFDSLGRTNTQGIKINWEMKVPYLFE